MDRQSKSRQFATISRAFMLAGVIALAFLTVSKSQAQTQKLIISPWQKICRPDAAPGSKPVCFTRRDAHLENGDMAASVVLIEPEGGQKLLRISLPLGLALVHGTRMKIDGTLTSPAPFVLCEKDGCISDQSATPELIAQMKKGKLLNVQAVNKKGDIVDVPFALDDFAKVNSGRGVDEAALTADQKKVEEDLKKRADEVRKKMESEQPRAR